MSIAALERETGLLENLRLEVAPTPYTEEVAPPRRRISQREALDCIVAQPTAAEVFQCRGAGRLAQHVAEVFGGQLIGAVESVRGLASSAIAVRRQGDAGAVGQKGDGLDEGDAVAFLDELEGVAAGVTAEAVKDLKVRIDGERRRLLGVKGDWREPGNP